MIDVADGVTVVVDGVPIGLEAPNLKVLPPVLEEGIAVLLLVLLTVVVVVVVVLAFPSLPPDDFGISQAAQWVKVLSLKLLHPEHL